jgi:catechol 2,3-dioxygenase-like lactoylglutathione lyase family enzyme
MIAPPRPVQQIAYFVRDAEAAARRHASLFGSGPYFLAERIPLLNCRHRGRPTPLDHTSAYGQWGEVMIEFVQQNDDAPSPFRDAYPNGGEGLHHLAMFVDDLGAELARLEAEGFAEAFYGETSPGVGFAFVDTRAAYGHMLELYAPTKPLLAFYAKVKQAAAHPEPGDPIRRITFRRS